jgi:hypothetical protein
MKRLMLIGALLAAIVMVFSAPASAGFKSFWTGKNSQHEPVLFLVGRADGVRFFSPLDTIFDIVCPVTGDEFTFELSFFGFQEPLDHGHFDLNLPDLQFPFDWQGTIMQTEASGTQSLGFAAYDQQGGLQDCGTGTLTWHAKPVGGGAPVHAEAPSSGGFLVQLVRDKDGRVTETITRVR